MDITIRKAQIQDIPEIIKMNHILNEVECSTFEYMKESLENNKNEVVLVAFNNGIAVGFI